MTIICAGTPDKKCGKVVAFKCREGHRLPVEPPQVFADHDAIMAYNHGECHYVVYDFYDQCDTYCFEPLDIDDISHGLCPECHAESFKQLH